MLSTVWGDVLTKGSRIRERYLANSYVGDPGRDTMGLKGMLSLCIFGSP